MSLQNFYDDYERDFRVAEAASRECENVNYIKQMKSHWFYSSPTHIDIIKNGDDDDALKYCCHADTFWLVNCLRYI